MTDKPNIQSDNEKIQYVALNPEMFSSNNVDDEIDLRELWNAIWKGKWIIIITTMIFAAASVFYALSLPNIYKSEALLAPASSEQQAGLSALSGQFGGLASLAGINLGGTKSDKTTLAIEIMKSRDFFANYVRKHEILPDLMAAKEWDSNTNQIVYDEELYLFDSKKWIRDVDTPRLPKPSIQEAGREFSKLFTVEKLADVGMVKVSVEHYSPYVAKQWVDWIIEDINFVMKARDKMEAEKSISYLQSQIEKTNIVEQQSLLYQLIEEQAKTLMFTEIRDEYVFKTIDPALVQELKHKPNKIIVIIAFTMIGIGLSIFSILILPILKKLFSQANY
ncbi:LPS O-antigen length regulator [Alteromonadaceae bacterium M269]|nr:LPS O-antigen length regulator [Alteromonadaceae bacterium M269]